MLAYRRFSLFLKNVAVSSRLTLSLESASSHPDQWVFTLGLTASSALDIFLTGILLYYLRKSKTGFAK